ncbi:MAG TPA: hypothetical protein VNN09_14930 [Candidatus Competibacteraceae bacterium]|nr:hypothetical protein [Candidatus Competibacteraceae bacterium]
MADVAVLGIDCAAAAPRLALACDEDALLADADRLDAVLCVLVAGDFLNGHCYLPAEADTDTTTLRREGWIWVHRGN